MPSSIPICTLFEGNYHFGLSVLINSLVSHGFTGTVYAGYRGRLPDWARKASAIDSSYPRAAMYRLEASDSVDIRFINLDTKSHFTNYKPSFMRMLLQEVAPDADGIYYLDPDIVVTRNWKFFEDWLSCGVALCEDVNSPLHENHPSREGWRRTFSRPLLFRVSAYANGGCIGISRQNTDFLEVWDALQEEMFRVTGGADVVGIGETAHRYKNKGFADCFEKTDQDALNAAIEACPKIPVSILGREAMGFSAGRTTLPHAIGPWKPWTCSYLARFILGFAPRSVDKAFWSCAYGPIHSFGKIRIGLTRTAISLCSFAGRFYQRR